MPEGGPRLGSAAPSACVAMRAPGCGNELFTSDSSGTKVTIRRLRRRHKKTEQFVLRSARLGEPHSGVHCGRKGRGGTGRVVSSGKTAHCLRGRDSTDFLDRNDVRIPDAGDLDEIASEYPA